MDTEGSGATRAGEEDFLSEDAYLVEEGLGLYVVCDGVEERPAGEIAAEVAVEAVEEFVARSAGVLAEVSSTAGTFRRFAGTALKHAMRAVSELGSTEAALAKMATTATVFLAHGRYGAFGHVGDGRAYLIRDHRPHLLTPQHDWTQDFGADSSADWSRAPVDTFSIQLRPSDTYILCTRTTEAAVDVASLARTAAETSPRGLANRIVSAAHEVQPDLDATVVVVRVRADLEPAWLSLSAPPSRTSFGHAVCVPA